MKRVQLTKRDIGLLFDCYWCSLLTFDQVHARHFPERAKSTVHNRLSQLRDSEYLRPFRVGTILHHGKCREVGVVYTPTKRALRALSLLFPEEDIAKKPAPLNTATLTHDILLADTLHGLASRYSGCHIQNGKYLSANGGGNRIPDAVLSADGSTCRIAVELELTPKSERRYRDLILEYRLSRSYTAVLYLVSHGRTADKIRQVITGAATAPGLPPPPTGKFYFANIDAFLKAPKTTPISNGENDLTVDRKDTQ